MQPLKQVFVNKDYVTKSILKNIKEKQNTKKNTYDTIISTSWGKGGNVLRN